MLPPQARILKHMGDLEGAARLADTARSMDLADRYLNTKCVKYMLRANQVRAGRSSAIKPVGGGGGTWCACVCVWAG